MRGCDELACDFVEFLNYYQFNKSSFHSFRNWAHQDFEDDFIIIKILLNDSESQGCTQLRLHGRGYSERFLQNPRVFASLATKHTLLNCVATHASFGCIRVQVDLAEPEFRQLERVGSTPPNTTFFSLFSLRYKRKKEEKKKASHARSHLKWAAQTPNQRSRK